VKKINIEKQKSFNCWPSLVHVFGIIMQGSSVRPQEKNIRGIEIPKGKGTRPAHLFPFSTIYLLVYFLFPFYSTNNNHAGDLWPLIVVEKGRVLAFAK
jgi:hypothetical protein